MALAPSRRSFTSQIVRETRSSALAGSMNGSMANQTNQTKKVTNLDDLKAILMEDRKQREQDKQELKEDITNHVVATLQDDLHTLERRIDGQDVRLHEIHERIQELENGVTKQGPDQRPDQSFKEMQDRIAKLESEYPTLSSSSSVNGSSR